MIASPASWFYVDVGTYVRSADGAAWRVDGKTRRPGAPDGVWDFALTNASGQRHIASMELDAAVDILVPTMSEAEALIAARLPVSGVRRMVVALEELRTYPDSKWVRAAIAAHLLDLHGVSVSPTAHAENKDIADMLVAHAASHARPETVLVPHVHVPYSQLGGS